VTRIGVVEKITDFIRNASYRYFYMVCSFECVRPFVPLQAGILNDNLVLHKVRGRL